MPNIGPLELVIVLVIALLILGPKRLPEAGRSLGQAIRGFRNSLSGAERDDAGVAVAQGQRQALDEARAGRGERRA